MSSIPVPDEQTRYSSRRQDDVDVLSWPVFSQHALDLLRSAGEVLHPEPGELLWDAGDTYDLYLILAGGVLLLDRRDDRVVFVVEEGDFVGELGMLMGQRAFLPGMAMEETAVLRVRVEELRRLVEISGELSDVLLSAFDARRRLLICGAFPPHDNRRMDPMSQVPRFDHVGITVADLDAVTAFFVGLGLEVENRMFIEGEFLDTVIGIPGSRTEIVMLQPPDGGTRLELSSFSRPDHLPGSRAAPANELGLRNVAFEVHDLQAAVNRAATDGYRLVGGIGEYEGSWRMAYVRGPEGIIVSLAERIG